MKVNWKKRWSDINSYISMTFFSVSEKKYTIGQKILCLIFIFISFIYVFPFNFFVSAFVNLTQNYFSYYNYNFIIILPTTLLVILSIFIQQFSRKYINWYILLIIFIPFFASNFIFNFYEGEYNLTNYILFNVEEEIISYILVILVFVASIILSSIITKYINGLLQLSISMICGIVFIILSYILDSTFIDYKDFYQYKLTPQKFEIHAIYPKKKLSYSKVYINEYEIIDTDSELRKILTKYHKISTTHYTLKPSDLEYSLKEIPKAFRLHNKQELYREIGHKDYFKENYLFLSNNYSLNYIAKIRKDRFESYYKEIFSKNKNDYLIISIPRKWEKGFDKVNSKSDLKKLKADSIEYVVNYYYEFDFIKKLTIAQMNVEGWYYYDRDIYNISDLKDYDEEGMKKLRRKDIIGLTNFLDCTYFSFLFLFSRIIFFAFAFQFFIKITIENKLLPKSIRELILRSDKVFRNITTINNKKNLKPTLTQKNEQIGNLNSKEVLINDLYKEMERLYSEINGKLEDYNKEKLEISVLRTKIYEDLKTCHEMVTKTQKQVDIAHRIKDESKELKKRNSLDLFTFLDNYFKVYYEAIYVLSSFKINKYIDFQSSTKGELNTMSKCLHTKENWIFDVEERGMYIEKLMSIKEDVLKEKDNENEIREIEFQKSLEEVIDTATKSISSIDNNIKLLQELIKFMTDGDELIKAESYNDKLDERIKSFEGEKSEIQEHLNELNYLMENPSIWLVNDDSYYLYRFKVLESLIPEDANISYQQFKSNIEKISKFQLYKINNGVLVILKNDNFPKDKFEELRNFTEQVKYKTFINNIKRIIGEDLYQKYGAIIIKESKVFK